MNIPQQIEGKNMTDNTSTKNPVTQTAKALSLGLSLPALAAAIPEPYSHWVYYAALVIAAFAMAATQIPVPNNPSSKLWWLYKIISFLARNSGEAANAAVMLKPPVKK